RGRARGPREPDGDGRLVLARPRARGERRSCRRAGGVPPAARDRGRPRRGPVTPGCRSVTGTASDSLPRALAGRTLGGLGVVGLASRAKFMRPASSLVVIFTRLLTESRSRCGDDDDSPGEGVFSFPRNRRLALAARRGAPRVGGEH